MYKEFYSFRHMPFTETVESNPNFVHLSKNYEMPLAILVSSLDKGVTLALVIGANGVGKTTFINYIRKYIQKNLAVGLITSPIHSCQGLLQQTLACFDREVKNVGVGEMVRQLREFLSIQFKKQNQQPSLLIIDDADSMALDAIKSLELLLDLNSDNNRLLQVVLVGRYQLRELLNKPELQGLLKRVETQCSLEPLQAEEIRSYIDHRLNVAGMAEQKLFNEEVCSVIYECSEGIPGKINLICDEALLHSSKQQKYEVSTAVICEVVKGDVQEEQAPEQMIAHHESPVSVISGENKSRWLFNTALVGAGILAGIFLISVFAPDRFSSSPENPQDEFSNELVESLVKENPIDQMKIPQEKEYPESLVGSEIIDDEKFKHETSSVKITAENLLATAESHLQALRLTTPKGENALDTYRLVLEGDPDNEMALQGIQRVAEKYRELAEYESNRGAYGKASSYLEQAAAILPESQDIEKALIQARKHRDQAKSDKVENQQTPHAYKKPVASAKDEKVAKLLAVAEQQFAASRLILPSKNNAYETYQAIFAIDKSNRKAKQRMQEIQLHLKSQLQDALDKQDYVTVRRVAEQIIAIPSYGAGNRYHEEAVFAAFETREIIEDQLKSLLDLAEQQRKTRHLTQPVGDNALESYRKILEIDPANEAASEGLGSLVEQYQTMVSDALSDGKTDQAMVIASEGLNAFPDNRDLHALRDSVAVQQDAALKQTEEKPVDKRERKLRPFANF